MIRVCAWCNPQRDTRGNVIGEVMGCIAGTKTYTCTSCEFVDKCWVGVFWPHLEPEYREECSVTHGICDSCFNATKTESLQSLCEEASLVSVLSL